MDFSFYYILVFYEGFPHLGGTRPFSNMWEFLLKLMFGIFMRFFADGNLCMELLVAGGFVWFPLHMTMVWYLARGAGIPAPSDAIDVCVSKQQTSISVYRRGWGFPAPPQGRRHEYIGHRADERKPSFLARARKTTSSER